MREATGPRVEPAEIDRVPSLNNITYKLSPKANAQEMTQSEAEDKEDFCEMLSSVHDTSVTLMNSEPLCLSARDLIVQHFPPK